MAFFPVLIVVVLIAIISRIIAGSMDHDRIKDYFESRGGAVQEIEWQLFGPGWCGDKNRIYLVHYRDGEGRHHRTYVKTSMLAGVYITEDEILAE